MAVVFFIL